MILAEISRAEQQDSRTKHFPVQEYCPFVLLFLCHPLTKSNLQRMITKQKLFSDFFSNDSKKVQVQNFEIIVV